MAIQTEERSISTPRPRAQRVRCRARDVARHAAIQSAALARIALVALVVQACAHDSLASVQHTGGAYWEPLTLHYRIDDGRSTREFRQTDLQRDRNGHFTTGEFATPSTGTLRFDFSLTARDGTPVSSGSVSLPLKADWIWGIEIRPSATDPAEYCMGCFGSRAFPLHPSYRVHPEDRLWVFWGGNSIRHPVVY